MTSNIASMLQFWKNFNLPQLQRDLDVNATNLAGRQDASDVSRRKLVEQSKEFKRITPEDVRKSVAPLLRSFQSEVDALSKRSKASEGDFLNLYKKLIELPDPVQALEQAEHYQKRAQRLADVETENQKLRETLAEYNKEFAEVKNQEVTIKNLREKVREYEKGKEDLAKQLTQEKNEEFQKQFVEKEKKLQETQLLIATKLGEAEQTAATYKAALEASQSELFDLKSKYDEEIAAKQAELDLVLGDLDRATQRAAISDKEIEKMRESLSSQMGQSEEMKSTTMEESFEALSRSSLEAELANKEKEISQLVEDVQHLQSSMGKLRDSSATAIAKLEEELAEKNTVCQDLQKKIVEREDYDEIKRELQIIKSTEFAHFDSSALDHQSLTSSTPKAKSLELLLMEKNRSQQSDNTALRAANAQLTESPEQRSSTSPNAQDFISEMAQRRKDRSSSISSTRYRHVSTSSNYSQPNPFSPTGVDFIGTNPILDPTDTLSQLQIQNQRQLNALLNLKILASLKAAVAAQNVSSAPLLASFMNFPTNQSSKPFYLNNFNDTVFRSSNSTSRRSTIPSPSSKPTSTESHVIADYLSQMQKLSSGNLSTEKPPRPRSRSHSHLSDHSDDENSIFTSNSNYQDYFGKDCSVRHPSDPVVSSVADHDRSNSNTSRYRSLSHTGGASRSEGVNTEELTRQVKEVLQANNIGQRAFGQYVLGLSQGSVSEILSKPKPWSKLTFKGKEPFYKMMDFLSSENNVESLKSLQRRDREERVLCGTRTHPVRNSDARSEQAIANILAAAREEMRAEQEKVKRAQEIYSYECGHSEREKLFNRRKGSDAEELSSPTSSRQSMTDTMTAIASGRCPTNVSLRSEKINPSTTNGVAEPTTITALNASLSSSIKNRMHTAAGSINGRPLLEDSSSDKEDSATGSGNPFNENSNVTLENRKTVDKDLKSSPNAACKEKKALPSSSFVSGSVTIKTEPGDLSSIAGYLAAVNRQGKISSKDILSATSKEEILSPSRCLIGTNIEQENLRGFYVTSTYNDPFIPPPLSPAVEDTRSSTRSESTCSPTIEKDIAYRSSFVSEESSRFIGENSEHSENSPQAVCRRGTDKSPTSPHSTGLLQEPVLFKELSCGTFAEGDRERDSTTKVSSAASASFSGMMSSGMSSLQTSTSIFDSHASYTELSPVTTGSLYNAQREPQEHELVSISSAFSSVENGQNGISSMLPPLVAAGSQQNVSSPVPTYSTLTNAVTSHVSHGDDGYDGDRSVESSSLASPIPHEALQKLSMAHIDTVVLTKQVRDRLVRHGICQRVFGEKILGLSQGTVSDILSHPKPWSKLTHKGREPFARMILWLADGMAGGLLPPHEDMAGADPCDNVSRSSSASPNMNAMNLTSQASNPPLSLPNGGMESGGQFTNLSPPSSIAHSPHSTKSQDRVSPTNPPTTLNAANGDSSPLREPSLNQFDRHFKPDTPVTPEQSSNGLPITPLQQMLNIQELAASCPKLDTFALTRKVKDLLTEHNIGQRIFGQAVLGLTQGSVSDLLSRPKLWRSLSLKGREPFVRMQLWLSDPNNIEQLKNLKLERWMEKKWGGKRQRPDGAMHSLSPVKKQRIVLSSEEKDVLRRAYGIEPYPSQETVDLLAVKLGRKSSTIVNWFHNYRSRVKRGFFPGEEVQDSSKKHPGAKRTVKQLLDEITLSCSHSNNSSNQSRSTSLNPQRPFSSKSSHSDVVGTGSSRRGNARPTAQVSSACWVRPQHVQSPSNFERYPSENTMKTETLDQHFQNLHSTVPDDMYSNSIMHVKEEAKMLQMHTADAMFSSSFSYPMTSTLPDIFKPSESSLSDPVAIAAASSFIQPKPIHDNSGSHFSSPPGQLFTNLDNPQSHHHDNYASLPNESSFTPISASKVSVSPPSPQLNSILPPVHTLTPKKSSFGPPIPSSSLTLPSASSLLSPPQTSMDNIQMEAAGMGFSNPTNNQSSHRLMNLTRPRYGTLIASNNNMNNNSQANLIKNVSLPGGVQLSVSSPARSPAESDNKITATVWVSSPNEVTSQKNVNTPGGIKSEASVLDALDEPQFASNPDKDNADDHYSWVF